MNESLPERVVRELSEGIGPRLGGSEGSHRARDWIASSARGARPGGSAAEVHLRRLGLRATAVRRAPLARRRDDRAARRQRSRRRARAPSREGSGPTAPSRSSPSSSTWCASPSAKTASGAPPCSCRRSPARRTRFPSCSGRHRSRPCTSRRTTATASWTGSRKGRRCRSASRPSADTRRAWSTGTSSGRFPARRGGSSSCRATTTRPSNCPGAMDNASGVAAMAEAARRAKERGVKHTHEFIAFAAEEWMLFGSEHYAEELARQARSIATRAS